MKRIFAYFTEQKQQIKEVSWFQKAIYLFLFYKCVTYLLHFNELFSENSFILHHQGFSGPITDLAFLLNNYYTPWIGLVCIIVLLILSILGLVSRLPFLLKFAVWILVVNTGYFLYPTLTGGDYLLHQLLFFNLFLSPKKSNMIFLNDLSIMLHNGALVSIKIQVCLGYFLAGWFKLTDAAWLSGHAVYDIFQIPEYTSPFLQSLPYSITAVLTFLTIGYQLLFPVLIWWRRAKIYLLVFGIIQYLLIAISVGLFSFGWLMIITYLLFLKYDTRKPFAATQAQ